jgi:hypothetical protein
VTRFRSLRLAPHCAALAAAAAITVIGPADADADAVHIRAGGSVKVRARGHVQIGTRPVRRHVKVRRHYHRPGFYYGVRFASPPPPPPPCYEGCGVAVSAYYTEPAPPATVYAPPPPPPPPAVPTFGLGLFAGPVSVEGNDAGGDLGLFARLRLSHHLRLEAEVSRTEYEEAARVDRRLGAALLYDFIPHGRLSPYLLGGLGIGKTEMGGGALEADTGYGELGVGLEWRLTRRFSLIGDLRAGAQQNRVDGDEIHPLILASTASIQEEERITRGRLGAILFF